MYTRFDQCQVAGDAKIASIVETQKKLDALNKESKKRQREPEDPVAFEKRLRILGHKLDNRPSRWT